MPMHLERPVERVKKAWALAIADRNLARSGWRDLCWPLTMAAGTVEALGHVRTSYFLEIGSPGPGSASACAWRSAAIDDARGLAHLSAQKICLRHRA
jgi:hypothetical protein